MLKPCVFSNGMCIGVGSFKFLAIQKSQTTGKERRFDEPFARPSQGLQALQEANPLAESDGSANTPLDTRGVDSENHFRNTSKQRRLRKHHPAGRERRFAYFFVRCKGAASPPLEDALDCKKTRF